MLSTSWSDWIGCDSLDCNATGYRSRSVLQEAVGDGLPCAQKDLIQTATCNTIIAQCIAMNCQYTNWSPWSDCPDSCIRTPNDCSLIPTQVRNRNVTRVALPGGIPCDWNSLVQTQSCPVPPFCSLSKQCEPTAPPPNFSQCHPCPEIACTISGRSITTMCTTTNALGPDTDCEPFQLLYSKTCLYADCNTQCINNNYSYFSRCSVPCGPGDFMSFTGQQCPNVSISSCELNTCTTGGMVSLLTAQFGGSPPSLLEICKATDSVGDQLSTTRCLAKCASSQTCNYAWQSVAQGDVTLSSSLPQVGTAVEAFWSYSSLAPCVTPNWDMVGATCLYICEDPQSTQFSLFTNKLGNYDAVRGLVFPFEDGSMSCPLTPDQLTGLCATPDNNLLGGTANFDQIGLLGIIPTLMANYTFSEKQSILNDGAQSYTFSCPISRDCIYQSWSDAGPWSQCSQETWANDLGTRSRQRTIVSQPQFLGDPCTVEGLQEFSDCNRSATLNSASEMWCPPYAMNMNVNQRVSEVSCHEVCAQMRAENGPDACNSFFVYKPSQLTVEPEVFLVQFPTAVNATSITTQSLLNLAPGFSVANLLQLEAAWSSGMQSCLPGWFLQSQYEALQAYSVQQQGCSDPQASLSTLTVYTPSTDIATVFLWGIRATYTGLGTALPFFTPTTASSIWDSKYFFKSQTFQGETSCAFYMDRTDILVEQCTSLTGAPISILSSTLFDIPYDFAQSCSLTDWTTLYDCSSSCQYAGVQTRTVIDDKISQGGLPCSRLATYQFSICTNFHCSETFYDLCVLQELPTLSSYATSCSSALFPSDVYLEHFDPQYLYEWANFATTSLGQTNILSFFSSSVRQNAFGGHLNPTIIDALNAQCGYSSCFSLSDGFYTFSQQPIGWELLAGGKTCTVSPSVQTCLASRLPQGTLSPGKRVWDSMTSQWQCPSTCRPGGLSLSCAVGVYPLSSCSCTPIYDTTPPIQTQSIPYSTYTATNSDGSTDLRYTCQPLIPFPYVFACETSSQCKAQSCPVGVDGTQCNSASGNGICDTATGNCICVSPLASKRECNTSCPRGPNGLPCSGEGTCNTSFSCVCNPGRFNGGMEACENAGFGLVGVIETLFYSASANVFFQPGSSGGASTQSSYTFQNFEPRCETTTAYCSGAQLFVPSDVLAKLVYHPFFPTLTEQSTFDPTKINPQQYSNICVNSLDASFNSDWIPANYLSLPLTSYSSTGQIVQALNCEEFLDSQGKPAYTLKARFTSHPNIPTLLHNKLFYTRCSDPTGFLGNSRDGFFLMEPITQGDSTGNYFDLVRTQTSISALCALPT